MQEMSDGTQQTATAAALSTRASSKLGEQAAAARRHADDLTKIVNGASRTHEHRTDADADGLSGPPQATLLTKVGTWFGSRKAA
jgi:hypothetical protein